MMQHPVFTMNGTRNNPKVNLIYRERKNLDALEV
jgi:hypothetical protein